MKKTLFGICGLTAALALSQPAEAALFVTVTDALGTATCNNSTAAGVTACTAAGFNTVLDGNVINFGPGGLGGALLGYNFAGLTVSGNVPGTPNIAFSTDSKTTVTKTTNTAGDLTVDFGGFNFTLPAPGPAFLSASESANWTASTAGDSTAFQAWERENNTPVVPGGDHATTNLLITSVGGTTNPGAVSSPDVSYTHVSAAFAVTGREVIHQALGTISNYQATAQVSSTPAGVPEPASMLLLGSGLLGLGARARRRMRKQ